MPATTAAAVAKKRSSRSASGNDQQQQQQQQQNGSNNGTKRPTTGELKPITLQEFYDLEDREAMTRSQAEDESLFAAECESLKKALARFIDNPADDSAEELKNMMTMQMITLRRLNRLAQFRNRKVRDRAAAERVRVEEQHLQLQNHRHEIEHLQKEVDRCLEFKSADQDIPLVSVGEFYENAPANISKPDVTKNDSHQQRLARLCWELEERKNLSKQLQELQERKNLLASDIGAKEQRLDSLKPMTQSIMEAARPMQEAMGIKLDGETQQREFAPLMPKELYVIGIQAQAYKDISRDDKFEIIFAGDVENAKKLNAALPANKSPSDSPEDGDSGNEDEERREDAGEQRPERLSRSKRRATVSEAVERRRELALLPHPLHVNFVIICADKTKVLLTFEYLNELRAVSVKCRLETDNAELAKLFAMPGHVLHEETLVQQLFPGDTGLICPNPVGQAKLEHLNIEYENYVNRIGYAFHWAQQLAGIKLTDSTMTRLTREAFDRIQMCDLLQKVVSRVRRRLQTRLSLHSQILSLEGTKISLPKALTGLYPTKVLSRMTSWKALSSDDFKAHPATQSLQTVMGGDAFASGWFFSATMERGEAKMVALVHVGDAYPDTAPLFILLLKSRGTRTAGDCSSLKVLEESVNCAFARSVPRPHKAGLLSAQLQYLTSRLDILLEAESARQGSKDFGREHLFGRKARGPDRELPFAFQESSNSFSFS